MAFQYFEFEHTWWILFQKRVVHWDVVIDFFVGQKWSVNRLVILSLLGHQNNFVTCHVILCLLNPFDSLCTVMVTCLKSKLFWFKETFYSFNNKHWKGIQTCMVYYGKCWLNLLLVKQTADWLFSSSITQNLGSYT